MVFGGGHSAGLVVVGDVDDVIDGGVEHDLAILSKGGLVAVVVDLPDGIGGRIGGDGEIFVKGYVFTLKRPALEGLGGGDIGNAGVRDGGLARTELIGADDLLIDDLPVALAAVPTRIE